MNFRLLLAILVFVPFVTVKSQDDNSAAKEPKGTPEGQSGTYATPTDDSSIVFTNVGQIYFKGKTGLPANPTEDQKLVMNIQGSALFLEPKDDQGNVIKTGELRSEGVVGLSLTGDWIVDLSATAVKTGDKISGFNLSGDVKFQQGFVKFNSKMDQKYPQYSATHLLKAGFPDLPADISGQVVEGAGLPGLYGGALDGVESVSLKNRDGKSLELKKKQTIKSYNVTADKLDVTERPRVVLPNIVVERFSHVALNHLTNLDIGEHTVVNQYPGVLPSSDGARGEVKVNPGGLFTVEAKYVRGTDPQIWRPVTDDYIDPVDANGQSVTRLINIPNFYFSSINNTEIEVGEVRYTGQIMYDLELFDKLSHPLNDINIVQKVVGDTKTGNIVELTPFSSPYKKLGYDYMLFNVLTKPTQYKIGGEEGPIVEYKGSLKQGEAYFIAQNVSGFDHKEIAKRTLAHPDNRAYGGYQFNRDYFLSKKTEFNKIPEFTPGRPAALDEVFQSPREVVKMTLDKGLNFIANPYMQPIDLADLMQDFPDNTPQVLDSWTPVSQAEKITVGKNMLSTLRNKFWVPGSSTIQWVLHEGVNYFRYNVVYYIGQSQGATVESRVIGPLQVFAVQASDKAISTSGKLLEMQLPYNRMLSDRSTPTPRSNQSSNAYEPIDEILLQTEVLGAPIKSRSGNDSENAIVSADRVAIVLRENASLASIDAYDSEKHFGGEEGNAKPSSAIRVKALDDNSVKTFGGILYTKSSHNQALMTNVVPLTTKRLPIYFSPTQTESKVRLTTKRMESLQSISKVWLIDKFEDNKVIELLPDTEYEFISKPLSEELAASHRFELCFGEYPDDNSSVIDTEDPIQVYYNAATLYIDKLIDKDRNSDIQIFDMQGRLVAKSKVTDIPFMTYTKPFNLGTYVVKITGKRNYTTKFIVLPH